MRLSRESFYIGLGNPNRHDGGVGIWLARALRVRGLRALALTEDTAAVIEAMDTHSDVVLLDSTLSGHLPGHVTFIDAHAGAVPSEIFRHPKSSFAAGEAVETARAMGCLPPQLLLVGIEGQDFSTGPGLTPQVEWAAWRLLDEIVGKPA